MNLSGGLPTQIISALGPRSETGPLIWLFGTHFFKMNSLFEGNQSWDYYDAGGRMYYYDYYGDDMNISESYLSNYQLNLTSLGRSTIYLTLLYF